MFSYASVPAPSRLYWRWQLIGWSLYSVFSAIVFAAFGRFTSETALILLVIVSTLAVLSHGLRYHILANNWQQLAPLPLLGRLLVVNALLSVLSQAIIWVMLISVVRPSNDGQPHGWAQFIGYAFNVNFVLWLWVGFYFGWYYLRSYKQAEVDKWKLAAAVREAEMHTLKAQINPHFMFNGLNNIRALVMENPARARTMITHLSDLLRYSIQLNSTERVPLSRELEIVEHYLELEAMQLEERLTYCLDIDPAALSALIPPMTLQLLVENAIKHGIAPRPEGGFVHVRAQPGTAATGNHLHIVVRNTGRYQPRPNHDGVGLRNARERLTLLFGNTATLDIQDAPSESGTVVAQLQLPILVAAATP
ncbi:histidine kinase [Hymenobacter tibetensis]|uniref:Histidine kinase n=1 Tax=Hymenobacter tibetensis TaxID=497967 RepID=A0ABY4D1F7_9BACT|nr:histidine kinase [Hymenobacter tibetensis]UOG76353.1 histidine kinase [Hymenobacter tibetensis]